MILFKFTSSYFIFSRVSSFSLPSLLRVFPSTTIASRLLSFVFAYVGRIASRLSCHSYVVFRLPCDPAGLFSLFLSCLEVSCVSSIILHACSLGCGLLFSLFLFGVCFWSFRFARCGASGRVGASALSLCCVLACVLFLLLPRLGKRVVICMFLERVVHIFLCFSFLFTCFSEWPYSTSRPGGNQVDGLPPV